jgi:hypothetical protein
MTTHLGKRKAEGLTPYSETKEKPAKRPAKRQKTERKTLNVPTIFKHSMPAASVPQCVIKLGDDVIIVTAVGGLAVNGCCRLKVLAFNKPGTIITCQVADKAWLTSSSSSSASSSHGIVELRYTKERASRRCKSRTLENNITTIPGKWSILRRKNIRLPRPIDNDAFLRAVYFSPSSDMLQEHVDQEAGLSDHQFLHL